MLKTIRMMTIVSGLLVASFGAKEQSKSARSDQELAAKIQKSIGKDDSLKAYANALDVIVQNGQHVERRGSIRRTKVGYPSQGGVGGNPSHAGGSH